MQPFAEFRLWTNRASTGEKAATGVAVAVVMALLAWVLVPVATSTGPGAFAAPGTPGSSTASGSTAGSGTASGGAASQTGQPGAVGPAAGPGATGTGAGGPAESSAPGAVPPGETPTGGSSECPSSSATGVTSRTIKIAVTIAEIVGPAGNATFGLPTVEEQKKKYDTVIDSVNAEGGVACRELVAQYYSVNPADQSDMHATCLDIENDGVFAVIDDGGEYAGADCFGQRHIAFIGENLVTTHLASAYYPYLMSAYNFYDSAYRTAVAGLKQRGFFDPGKGFKKLGFMYFSCYPELITEEVDALHRAGVSDDDIVKYDAGCPSPPLAAPSDLQQAILKFKSSGVSHVTFAYFPGSIGNFTNVAQQQGFHPTYGLADDGYIGVSYGTSKPNRDNFDGAITITTSRYGEENTPGYTPTAGTNKCNRLFLKAGMPPIYRQSTPSNGGWVCDLVWMFRAAVDNAPALSQDALAAGLMATRSMEFSFPGGPNDFAATHGVTSGAGWRAARYVGSCRCWRLADPTFHRT